jgi:hypothetical protein
MMAIMAAQKPAAESDGRETTAKNEGNQYDAKDDQVSQKNLAENIIQCTGNKLAQLLAKGQLFWEFFHRPQL